MWSTSVRRPRISIRPASVTFRRVAPVSMEAAENAFRVLHRRTRRLAESSEEHNMSIRDVHKYRQNFSHYPATKIILKSAVFCCAVICAAAAPVKVCLVNHASLSLDTLRYVEAGLRAQEKELAVAITFSCDVS